jgi:hypothetical protein
VIKLFIAPSPDELFSHPLRWAGRHLAFYAAASVVAGSLFLAGAAVYSYFTPMPKPAPVVTEPAKLIQPPTTDTVPTPSGPLVSETSPGTLPEGYAWIPASKTIGANVFDWNNTTVGQIKDFTVSPSGQTSVTIKKKDGGAVTAPVNAFSWTSHNDSVRAVVKSSDDMKRLFGG